MDSGWIAFTVLLSVLGIAIMLGLVKSYLFPVATVTQDAFTKLFGGILGGFLRMSLNVVPITLFTFGFASDLINQEMRMSIPSIAAFLLMIVLRALTTVQQMRGALPQFAPAGGDASQFFCTLPGLEFIENPWLPTSVLSTIIISFYYLFWAAHYGQKLALIGAITGFAVAASTLQFTLGSCANLYVNMIPSLRGFGVLLPAWIVGLIVAGITYGVVVSVYPSKSPIAPGAAGSLVIPGGSQVIPGGTCGPGFTDDGTGNCIPVIPGAKCAPGFYDDGSGNCVAPTPNQTCPVGQKYFEADSRGPAGCRCPDGTMPGSGGTCGFANQSSAPSGGEQTFVAELYRNGKLISSSLS